MRRLGVEFGDEADETALAAVSNDLFVLENAEICSFDGSKAPVERDVCNGK